MNEDLQPLVVDLLVHGKLVINSTDARYHIHLESVEVDPLSLLEHIACTVSTCVYCISISGSDKIETITYYGSLVFCATEVIRNVIERTKG